MNAYCSSRLGFGERKWVSMNTVAIVNEAVFTKEKQSPDALLGMDILLIALERSKKAL